MPNLRKALNDHLAVVERIRTEFPGEDDEALRDTVLGETYIDSAIAAVLREARVLQAMAEVGMKEIIEADRQRQARLFGRAERLKALALWAAQEAGMKTIPAPDFTATIGTPKRGRVVITDEAALPPEYVSVNTVTTPKKKDIGDALERGEDVPGAELGNPIPFWTIHR